MTIYQGYTPPEKKCCTHCHAVHEDQLYELCPLCREGDKLAESFSDPRSGAEREIDKLSLEWQATIKSIRPGG